MAMPTLAQGLGAAGNLFGLFGGNSSFKNPAEASSPYLDQVPGTISPYYQPYINAGTQALGQNQNQYSSLINDPGAKMQSIGAGYQQSPGYSWNVDQATKAGNQAAAAGGMAGSPQHQQQLATTVSGLANQDYYNYLNKALGLYGTGLQGNSDLTHLGYGASNELAQSLANNLQSQASLAYAGQQAENESSGGLFGGIGDIFGGLFG